MSKNQMQAQASTEAQAPVLDSNQASTSTSSGSGRGNQAAIDRLSPEGSKNAPPVTLGDVGDANSFMSATSAALDAALPTRGSFAKLSVAGNIPLATGGVADITFTPSLDLQVAREKTGEYSAMIATKAQIKASAGVDGWGWLPDFEAYVSGYLKGSVKIQGDSATEIMNLFMLSVRHIMESACDAAGAPADMKAHIAGAGMGEDAKLQTLHGMDKNDKVVASVGMGAEAGAKAGAFSGSVGADLTHTTTLSNTDGNRDELDVTSKNSAKASVSVAGAFSMT